MKHNLFNLNLEQLLAKKNCRFKFEQNQNFYLNFVEDNLKLNAEKVVTNQIQRLQDRTPQNITILIQYSNGFSIDKDPDQIRKILVDEILDQVLELEQLKILSRGDI